MIPVICVPTSCWSVRFKPKYTERLRDGSAIRFANAVFSPARPTTGRQYACSGKCKTSQGREIFFAGDRSRVDWSNYKTARRLGRAGRRAAYGLLIEIAFSRGFWATGGPTGDNTACYQIPPPHESPKLRVFAPFLQQRIRPFPDAIASEKHGHGERAGIATVHQCKAVFAS
jgi:hypothetical protein